MAEKCICCGKKIGLLRSHLNNQVCDNCYFPIDGYLSTIKENLDIQVIEENYIQLTNKIITLCCKWKRIFNKNCRRTC